MNENNLALLNRMQKLQYYDFVRYALGLKFYLQGDKYDVIFDGKDKNDKKLGKVRVLAHLKESGRKKKTFIIIEDDFNHKCFHDETNEKYSVESYFDEIADYLIWLIMIGVLGVEDYFNDIYHEDISIGNELFEQNKPKDYRFILGAGINKDYGLGNWDSLINAIRKRIRTIKNIPTKPDILLDFEQKMSNTNYIAPQILKDLNSQSYYGEIYSSLYASFNVNKTIEYYNPSMKDTTLYQIARIASKKNNTVVLSFNYDDVFEQVMKNNFTPNCYSDYYKASTSGKVGIRVIHPHGFLPYNRGMGGYPSALIFSSFEYMNGYLYPKSYARNKLYEHIMQPCILVGNSLSDYEEQKVFFLHHKKYLSQFSYLFTTKRDSVNRWMDIYKSVYFLKMGVIPVFFDDYPQMVRYLKTF